MSTVQFHFFPEANMRRAPFILLGILAVSFLTTAAQAAAAGGKLAAPVQMFAGPGSDYPFVRRLAKGLSVEVHGCLKSWDWCDVTWRGTRGWVPAAGIAHRDDEKNVPITEFGPEVGVPEVSFQLNSYWDKYYNSSLWYQQRDMWARINASYNVQ